MFLEVFNFSLTYISVVCYLLNVLVFIILQIDNPIKR